MMIRFFLISLLFGNSVSLAVEKLPVEAFANLPAIQNIRLSPDGTRFVAHYNKDGFSILMGREVSGKKMNPLVRTDNNKFQIRWIKWINNDVIAVSIEFPSRRFGTKTVETRLMKVSFEGGDFRAMVKSDLQRDSIRLGTEKKFEPQFQDDVIDWLPNDPNHILLAASFDSPYSQSVYRVSTKAGRKLIHPAKGDARHWVTDTMHRPRVYVAHEYQNGIYKVNIKNLEKKRWKMAWKFKDFDETSVWPLGFGNEPDVLYVRAYHEGFKSIFKVNVLDPELTLELVHAGETRDVDGELLRAPSTGEVIGVVSNENNHYEIWADDYKPFVEGVSKVFGNRQAYIKDLSQNEERYLVYSEGSDKPGSFYFGDRATNKLIPIAHQYPKLKTVALNSKKRIEYTARDGQMIEGYLTIPKGMEAKNLPVIIHPHGGPIARNDAGFDYWTQFFANRGYAVLQMNFRGSSGYGFEFTQGGLNDWGLQMQRDISDGTQWLIEQGIADADRLCIAGASFGGYSALMSAALEPDTYQCAISFAGVFDMPKFRASKRQYTSSEYWDKQLGKDDKELTEASPQTHVKAIKAATLLVHGANDRVVSVSQSKDMAKALKRAKNKTRYLELKDGDHHLSIEANRVALFKAMDAFLAKHLPAE